MIERKTLTLALVLGLAAAGYIAAGLLGIQAHLDPVEMDTVSYLKGAAQIRETGGVLNHIPNCLNGVYREATQHPLYLLVLSPFAERDIHFFIHAKIASFVIGFLFLFVFFFTARSVFGAAEGLIGLCLLLSNATFLNMTTMVACESLFTLFFLLFWYFAAQGFAPALGGAPRRMAGSNKWLVAGFFASLAFLTKSLGILALPIFFISTLVVHRARTRELLTNKFFWGFFAVFFIVSSPLLIRNAKIYGTPLYSDSTAVMWVDRWHDFHREAAQADQPTSGSYLRTHTAGQILTTFFQGLFGRDPKMISDGLKPFTFWKNGIDLRQLQGFHERSVPWQDFWAAALFLLCLIGFFHSRKKPAAILAFVSLVLFLVFVAWYSKIFPGSPPTRLLYPILFFILIFAAKTVSGLGDHLIPVVKAHWRTVWASVLAGIFSSVYLFSVLTHFDWKTLHIDRSYAFNRLFIEQIQWTGTHVRAGEKIMVGGVFMTLVFYFESKIKIEVLQWPQAERLADVEKFVREHGVRYGILDLATAVYDLKAYREYFEVGPHIGLRSIQDMPEPFHRLTGDLNAPSSYEIYEFNT